MDHPILSRGTGRSGPKRKTGCLTCRKRKVRCGEEKPICSNCTRLCLDCAYTVDFNSKHGLASPAASTTSSGTRAAADHRTLSSASQDNAAALESFSSVAASQSMVPPPTLDQYWTFDESSNPAFATPFQDVFFSSLDSFGADVDFATSNACLGPETNSTAFPFNYRNSNDTRLAPDVTESCCSDDRRCRFLIEHFVWSANPISVVLPTHTEWASACRSLLAMANESSFLLAGICALSALHLYIAQTENAFEESYRYYKSSSREVTAVLNRPDVEDRPLKQAFAALFLLTRVELMAQTTSEAKRNHWPLQHLHSAHHHVRVHSDRIRRWTGISKRLLTWMTLLQTKAEYNSGYPALEHSSSTLSKSTGDPFVRTPSSVSVGDGYMAAWNGEQNGEMSGCLSDGYTEDDIRTTSELAYDTINQPGLDFYLKSQAFTSRIISIDRYHRHHETLETEFETLKDGQRINSDLHALWTSRPTTMAFLNDPKGLESALQPKLANRVLLNLRVYTANFYALFIYLHRVAFKTYPATSDVNKAVSNIVNFAQDILDPAKGHRSDPPVDNKIPLRDSAIRQSISEEFLPSETDEALSEPGSESGLPATMLWPLFLAALECSIPDRFWLLQTMHDMDKRHVPNAARTVFLLEEVLRRQDEAGRRIDHRSVRHDLFEGELSVLY